MKPLDDMRVVTMAVNIPGPVAAARLRALGARVTKIEPPTGDPLAAACPAWYRSLVEGQEIARLHLKTPDDRRRLDAWLAPADLLLTASRPSALARLGLDWPTLHARHPRLVQVAIVGWPDARAEAPGHDLTYQAGLGLLDPPNLPRTLLADLAGAEQAVSTALALLLVRERAGAGEYAQVSLAQAAGIFAAPLAHGLTAPGGLLNGALPGYQLYRAQHGWIAIAALEPRFRERLQRELDLSHDKPDDWPRVFLSRSAQEWESWAKERELPLVAVRAIPAT
jgi:crotonobetainyl-CoA:carnitine CoA-transferase CaiB-like acyl-CoA transferase